MKFSGFNCWAEHQIGHNRTCVKDLACIAVAGILQSCYSVQAYFKPRLWSSAVYNRSVQLLRFFVGHLSYFFVFFVLFYLFRSIGCQIGGASKFSPLRLLDWVKWTIANQASVVGFSNRSFSGLTLSFPNKRHFCGAAPKFLGWNYRGWTHTVTLAQHPAV